MNPFNSEKSNVTKVKTQNFPIMATITNRILKFKPKINRGKLYILCCYYL